MQQHTRVYTPHNDTINMGKVTVGGGGGGGRFTCNNCCTRFEQNRALDDLVCTILPTNVLQRNGGGVWITHIAVLRGLMQYDEYNRRKLITLSYSMTEYLA